MKKGLFALTVTASLLAACTSNSVKKAKITDTRDSVSYLIGADYGTGINSQLETFPGEMNTDEFIDAFVTTFKGDESKIIIDDARSIIMTYVQDVQAAETDSSISIASERVDSISYLLGADYGKGIGESLEQFPGGMNMEAFLDAFTTTYSGDSSRIVLDDARSFIMSYLEKVQQEEAAKQLKENKEYLDNNAKNDSIQVTESGLQYKIITEGKGEKPTAESKVSVHYTGKLTDGTVFDSSVERGQPASFSVGGVIPGWTEALQLMSVGSKWTLYIPSELAYGANPPSPSIPANAILIFDVELLEIAE